MRDTSIRKKVAIALVGVLAAVGGLGVSMHMIEARGLKDTGPGDTGEWGDEYEPESLFLADTDYISEDEIDAYLIAGTDGGGEDLGEGLNGELADFIAVMLIDNTTEKYAFYQIDRNSMVDVQVRSEDGDYSEYSYEQICTAHWYGIDETERAENLMAAVSGLLGGIELDGYYILNMADIGKVNDAIGGVTVDIDTDMTNLDPEFVKGATVHLTDKQAERYLRARKDVGDGTNAARMARQRQYMQKAYNMVIGQLRENPEYINDLYIQLEDKVESDGTGKRMSVITNQLASYQSMGIITFDGETKIGDTIDEGIEHEEFYTDENSILSGLKKVMNISVDQSADDDE